jgi:hypothetical protein
MSLFLFACFRASDPSDLGDITGNDPTAFAKSDFSEHVFYRSGLSLMHRWWLLDQGWKGPEDLGPGGVGVRSAPAAVEWQNTYADVFYLGNSTHLIHRRGAAYASGQWSWSAAEDLGGNMTGGPAVVYNPIPGSPREEVYYRNASGGIDVVFYNNGGASIPATWLFDANLYPGSGSHPSAAVLGNTTWVFWRAADGYLKYARFGVDTTPLDLDSYVEGSPAVAARWDRIDLLAKRSTSLQHRVWQESFFVGLLPQEQTNWCWAATGEMITKYWGNPVSQCVQVDHETGDKFDCCNNGSSANCNVGGSLDWTWLGFHAEGVLGTMTQAQIENQVVAQRPWHHARFESTTKHSVVGVDRLWFNDTFWVGINDPGNGGSQYLQSWAAYTSNAYFDQFNLYPLQ